MEPLRIALPGELALACPHCRAHWRMETAQLSGVETLHCPRCARAGDLYDLLEPKLRRRVYGAVRDMLEQRVHEQRQMDRAGYFEDEANIAPA